MKRDREDQQDVDGHFGQAHEGPNPDQPGGSQQAEDKQVNSASKRARTNEEGPSDRAAGTTTDQNESDQAGPSSSKASANGGSGTAGTAGNSAAAAETVVAKQEEEEEEDDFFRPQSSSRSSVKRGEECPFLDTVSRQNLDFDFEKCCSVTLSPVNVYVCLVCGKYFTGRGLSTPAYTHALETAHHMFMKLDNGRVFCLPDNYEVVDRSLDDIRKVRDPQLTSEEVKRLDSDVTWARALDGTEYMPGLVGLNNMRANDYANVVIQAITRVTMIRDYFLIPANYKHCKSVLVQRFGELLRKLWNVNNFKGQVSPHEFMQAVMRASKKRFTIEARADPVEFWSWLVNTLHFDLTDGKPKKQSIITKCFQGELEVITLKGTGKGKAATATEDVVERTPFLLLAQDLPPTPLFKDVMEKNIIPQVPIFQILHKYDGDSVHDDIKAGRRRFRITRLPLYLCMHFKRFTKNNFFIEKNITIVNFPVKKLELRDIIPTPTATDGSPLPSKYDLIANIVHDGKAGEGTYRVHVHRKAEDIWYELQDLTVIDILPQMVALSEAYFQVYELKQAA